MSVLNLSGDEAPECPLCMELLELDDISFYPCACGYQVLNLYPGREVPECPLCTELLELDDISFYPCACGYQVLNLYPGREVPRVSAVYVVGCI
jgi:hypothetical protein